jgi:solute carrier family 45 protein 1/2/4
MKNLSKDLFKVEERTEQLEDSSTLEDEENLQPLPLTRLLLLTVCTAGQAFSWACQFTYMTPHFLELGLEKEWANFLWIAGPVSGLIVQPTIGAYSDRCTSRFGRRRPFLFAGMLFMVCGLLLVANSKNIGILLGDSSRSAPRGALVVSIIGFWIIDLSNNAIQVA